MEKISFAMLAIVVLTPRPAMSGSMLWGQSRHRTFDSQGCEDADNDCLALGPALWNPDGTECRYPAAERCLRTCGQCWRLKAAATCRSAVNMICAPFCHSRMNWRTFLAGAVARSGLDGANLLHDKFPVAEFPGFLSAEEADILVTMAERLVYHPEDALPPHIRDVEKIDCEEPSCLFHPLVGEIYRRVSELLGVQPQNFESMEFLRYGRGQHYKPHMDSDDADQPDSTERSAGIRVMTVFFYLSDVEAGGATRFPNLGLDVQPKKGKVIIWANAQKNFRKVARGSLHQAMPVERGVKVAANFWVHPYDFRGPERHGHGGC